MAKGFVNVSTSGSGDVSYYLRESECLHVQSSANLSSEWVELLEQWKQLERQEKLGSKELGIRGRHDAQVRKNYTLSLPNELSPLEAARRIEAMLKETPIKDCSYSICIHRGEKDGVTNLHAHVLVNERNLKTMKKDRHMIKKAFLEQEFRPKFVQAFAAERALGKDLVSRERIATVLFQSNPQAARTLLSNYQQESQQANERQALVALLSGYAATSQVKKTINAENEHIKTVSLEQKWEPMWQKYAQEQKGCNQLNQKTNELVNQVSDYLEKNNHPEGARKILALPTLPKGIQEELERKLEKYERIIALRKQVKAERSRLSLKVLNPFLGFKERTSVNAMLSAIDGHGYRPDMEGYRAASKGGHMQEALYYETFQALCEQSRQQLPSFTIRVLEHQKIIKPIQSLSEFAAQNEQKERVNLDEQAKIEEMRKQKERRNKNTHNQRYRGPKL